MESRLRARAEVMAERTAKDSATRGDATKSEVAVKRRGDTRSSMIQPRPACPED